MKKKQGLPRSRWVRKTVLGCIIASQVLTGFTLTGGAGSKAAAAEPLVVSTWMWNPYVIEKEADSTLQQLTDKKVNRVYLFIDSQYPAAYYSNFIKKANARGVQVHAMSGAPNWVLSEHNPKMYEFIHWVKQYNNSVQPEERFAGIHLDVEPYVLPEWRQDSDTVIGLWMDTVSGFAEEVKVDSNLTVGIDMPVWLNRFQVRDGYGGRTTLSDWMIRRLDQVTLMAYLDKAEDIVKSVEEEIAEADRAGVPVLVAVDTVDNGEPGGSFYNKGHSSMITELNSVESVLSKHPSYKGYSIHEWD
ncbi:MAG: hypothetical protein K0S39_5113, partial [Paenibacillus sp.]|nr:hypothetical protein [Paenibacillus sp.]